MANPTDSPNLFTPFLLWADMGMRAAEATVASTQNITNGADKLTRAIAGTGAAEIAGDDARALPAGMDGIAGMQRLVWDLMTQNWMQWMSTVGNLMSAGAGVGLAPKVAGQDNPLEAARDSLRPAAWGKKLATGERGTPSLPARRRKAQGSTYVTQHALASSEPKPRRTAAAKRRRTQRASRR